MKALLKKTVEGVDALKTQAHDAARRSSAAMKALDLVSEKYGADEVKKVVAKVLRPKEKPNA